MFVEIFSLYTEKLMILSAAVDSHRNQRTCFTYGVIHQDNLILDLDLNPHSLIRNYFQGPQEKKETEESLEWDREDQGAPLVRLMARILAFCKLEWLWKPGHVDGLLLKMNEYGSCHSALCPLCVHQVLQEKAGLDPRALQARLALVALLGVQVMPESAGLQDPLDTATPLSVLVFLTTGRDTSVSTEPITYWHKKRESVPRGICIVSIATDAKGKFT